MEKLVYRHRRLDTKEIFYIGIGDLSRAKSKRGRSIWWHKVVNKAGYEVEIIADNLSWDDACELEQLLILEYGRRDLGKGSLVNMTDGGDGTLGCIISDEHKKIISEYGKNRTAEQRKKISDRLKGRKLSEETRTKISIANTGKIRSDEAKEKWRVSGLGNKNSLGHKHTDSAKLKMSQARKGVPKTKEHNLKNSEAKKKVILDSQTGIYYYGVADLSSIIGLSYDNLAARLNGKLKNTTNFKYV